jgi:Fe-Mn family superoxide dismutase
MLAKLTRRFASFKEAKLPELKFDLNELEPVLGRQIMEVHYKAHHQTYVNDYNKAMEAFLNAEAKQDHNEQLKQAKLINFNLGGHFNHSFFWENLAPPSKDGGVLPAATSKFGKEIVDTFSSFDKLIAILKEKGVKTQGSGWIWLAADPHTGHLKISNTHNQETISQKQMIPLLTIDVWEHAYYLNYLNKRAVYLDEIWKVVNWKKVEERYNNLGLAKK